MKSLDGRYEISYYKELDFIIVSEFVLLRKVLFKLVF